MLEASQYLQNYVPLVIVCRFLYTVTNVYERFPSPAGKPGMSLIKLFLAGDNFALGVFFPNQKRKIPGNHEMVRKSLIMHIPGFPAGDGNYSLAFSTV
jgi:hypothetical protein